MKKFRLFVLLLAVGCVAFPQRSPAPVTIRPGEGVTYTAPGSEEVPNQKDAQTQYDNALAKEKSGDIKSALEGYRKTVKRFPKSTVAPSAQYKIGEILEKRNDLDGAATAYETLVKRYPHSTDFNSSLEGEFRIGDAYLDGRKQRLLGVPTMPSRDRAIAIFTIITANAPYSRYAAQAQYKIGQAYETEVDYSDAVTAYQKVVDKYPTDPLASDAMYQIAYCFMQVAHLGSYDRNNTQRAREGFEDFLAQYPNHEKAAQAREDLTTLANQQTGGSLQIADYYYKQAQYRAAVVYYNDVIRQEPNSAASTRAQARLDSIRTKYGDKYFEAASPNAPGSGLKPVVPKLGDGRLQAQTDTAKRPDYVGPPISAPTPPPAPAASGGSGSGSPFNPPVGNGAPTPDPRPDATPLPVPAGDQPSLPSQ